MNRNPKKTLYLRTHDSSKNHKILLAGNTRWLRDIELLLEDQWKNISCPEDFSSFAKSNSESPPKMCVAELGAYNENESKILDLPYPRDTEKLLVTHSVKNYTIWRKLQRDFSGKGIKCLELSSDSREAAKELSEVLTSLCTLSVSLPDNLQIIQNAYHGFMISESFKDDQNLSKLFKLIASKFIFDPVDVVTGNLLAETHQLWTKPKDTNSPIYFAYIQAENSISDETIFHILNFSKKCSEFYKVNQGLDEAIFENLISESSFKPLTKRMIRRIFAEVRNTLPLQEPILKHG